MNLRPVASPPSSVVCIAPSVCGARRSAPLRRSQPKSSFRVLCEACEKWERADPSPIKVRHCSPAQHAIALLLRSPASVFLRAQSFRLSRSYSLRMPLASTFRVRPVFYPVHGNVHTPRAASESYCFRTTSASKVAILVYSLAATAPITAPCHSPALSHVWLASSQRRPRDATAHAGRPKTPIWLLWPSAARGAAGAAPPSWRTRRRARAVPRASEPGYR